jgi:glucose/arabinose dehydrogenase
MPIALSLVMLSTLACAKAAESPAAKAPAPATEAKGAKEAKAARPLTLGTEVSGFNKPLAVVTAPGERDRFYVVEQGGRIRILDSAAGKAPTVRPVLFFDASKLIATRGNEQGLLGLAFHPQWPKDRRAFIGYTDVDGNNVVAQLQVDTGKDFADPTSLFVLLAIEDFASNHNGGHVVFGPDGKLWVGTGDGGGGGDPKRTAQSDQSRLGKMLRVTVDPPPKAQGQAVVDVWAKGLRNPWRYAFDVQTGALWIADVGQNKIEEVNLVPKAAQQKALNFGWSRFEGDDCFREESSRDDKTAPCSNKQGLTFPVFSYDHSQGCSVTGGVVNSLAGARSYLVADYCSGTVWALTAAADGKSATSRVVAETQRTISAFGDDPQGRTWLCDHQGGKLVELRASAKAP